MKRLFHIFITFTVIFAISSCEDYLTVESPSQVDEDFVFSTPEEAYKTLMGCYGYLINNTHIHSNRTFYEILVVGSDSECHPEAYIGQDRHKPEGLSVSELPIDHSLYTGMWEAMYPLVNRLAIVRDQIGRKSGFKDAKAAGTVNAWTQLYGEAVTMRAFIYYELCRIYGDIPYFDEAIYSQSQIEGAELTPRFELYDKVLQSLKEVEPHMYRLGEGGITAERVNRTFAQALIGRIALHAGGFSTCRTDLNYGVDFEQIGSVKWNAKYVRPTNYKTYYEMAKTYLEMCINNPGSASLLTTDERGAKYDNPFQRHFQYMMDLKISPESLFEFGNVQGVTNIERPYAFGRPSNGGNGGSFPNNNYGQSRMYPVFYYGDYDNADLRRDVTITISANTGACSERLISLRKGNRLLGGPCNNKWDESRMANPYAYAQRMSGINAPYMRMADAILLLAEVYAELGDEAKAKAELTKVRSRAFSPSDRAAKVTNYINSLSGEALKEGIAQERKLEFAGEGLRRYDLIRTGKFPKKIKEVRDAQRAMVAGLKTQGYYTFPNGNQISAYIWTKYVNTADFGMNYMLTTQCTVPESDQSFPLCFPGWRGNRDGWGDGMDNKSGNRSLAIKGLFRYIDPNGAEAAALEADGYEKTNWGVDLVAEEDENVANVFRGYTDQLYSEGAPPRYPYPINSITIKQSNGLITNGYDYPQQ